MPAFQMLFGNLNKMFSPPVSDELDAELFAPDRPYTDAADALGAGGSEVADIIGQIPESIIRAMRAAIYSGLTRSPKMAITLSWAPSYDYELHVWEAPGTERTPGGITILFKSRYPSDPHPLEDTAQQG